MDIVSLPMDLVGSVISFLDRRSVWGGLLSASRGAASLRDHECLLRRNEARGFRTIRVDASCPKWQIDRSLALRGYCVLDVAIPASGERRVVVRTEPLPVPNDTEIVPNGADLEGVLLSGDAHTVLPELRSVHLVAPLEHPYQCPPASAAVLRQVTCPNLTTLICHWF
eukprot:Polyplicarium_translucidae@DN3139_c0_g1_i2.p1